MISTMRERLSAKLGNKNDNAFKMRKLFKMYDKQDTGMVRISICSRSGSSSRMFVVGNRLLPLGVCSQAGGCLPHWTLGLQTSLSTALKACIA